MSGSQPRHLWPNLIPQRLSPGLDMSGPQTNFQRGVSDMSGPRPGHVQVSDTPTARFSRGAIKGPPYLSSTVDHSFHIANTLRHSIELPTFSSKLHSNPSFLGEIWASLLSDPLNLYLNYFTDDLCVFVTLEDLFPRWTRLSGSHQSCGWPRKVYIVLSFVGIW
jgi:hypothetical protein